jgi:hypothetical protein
VGRRSSSKRKEGVGAQLERIDDAPLAPPSAGIARRAGDGYKGLTLRS